MSKLRYPPKDVNFKNWLNLNTKLFTIWWKPRPENIEIHERGIYEKAMSVARDNYDITLVLSWQEYKKIETPAWDEYIDARAKYERAKELNLESIKDDETAVLLSWNKYMDAKKIVTDNYEKTVTLAWEDHEKAESLATLERTTRIPSSDYVVYFKSEDSWLHTDDVDEVKHELKTHIEELYKEISEFYKTRERLKGKKIRFPKDDVNVRKYERRKS